VVVWSTAKGAVFQNAEQKPLLTIDQPYCALSRTSRFSSAVFRWQRLAIDGPEADCQEQRTNCSQHTSCGNSQINRPEAGNIVPKSQSEFALRVTSSKISMNCDVPSG